MVQIIPSLSRVEFRTLAQNSLSRFSTNWLNVEQDNAVNAASFPPLFIVAGPGTGKTTVLALRTLKHIFVDGFYPDTIIATTFTRKAAKELRSRILGWGVVLHGQALRDAQSARNTARVAWLEKIDINAIRTGTLDSLAQEMIEDDRQPGEITPTVIEGFLAAGLLRRGILFTKNWYQDQDLETHLQIFTLLNPQKNFLDFKTKIKVINAFADRVCHDDIDLRNYSLNGLGFRKLSAVVEQYHTYLEGNNLMDFALLEQEILERLRLGRLNKSVSKVHALLVDEFQDTNYLQEQIYYELARRAGASLTVVGDDDQSIFRFRGATVEIFRDFQNRCVANLGQQNSPLRVDLRENYRSTVRIVGFFNHFVAIEPDYQAARTPNKLPSIAAGPYSTLPDFPILGMFRTTLTDLTHDIAEFLGDIFIRGGKTIQISAQGSLDILAGTGGGFGDAVLLSHSVAEQTEFRGQRSDKLPLLLRQYLKTNFNVEVFNPRGRSLGEIEDVSRILGLMLECIDPSDRVQSLIQNMPSVTNQKLDSWRATAQQFIASNPPPGNLQSFVSDWGRRFSNSGAWPNEWPLLELMFTLVAWLPSFQHFPEGQIYLEAIARATNEAGQIGGYSSMIKHTGTYHDDNSVKQIIWEVFAPIADDSIEVDEEIMPYVPRTHFPIMTIHQAKGLEFPLVIVDVGSNFTRDHAAQRKFRYPEADDNVHLTENHIASFSPVGTSRIQRTGVQRAFDDLRRLYYVAKSRPHCILMLVGLDKLIKLQDPLPSVAMGDLYLPVPQRKVNNKKVPIARQLQFIPAEQWSSSCSDDTVALI